LERTASKPKFDKADVFGLVSRQGSGNVSNVKEKTSQKQNVTEYTPREDKG